jgi:hypothetical protein
MTEIPFPGASEILKPTKGVCFHWYENGAIQHQGYLLALNSKGYGKAQLFEWFLGQPSDVIEVTPDYLRDCVFYTSDKAMNAAYVASEVQDD